MEATHEGPIGILTAASRFSVAETIDRLAETARAGGNTIFARIDHAANAAASGLEMRPTQVLIFGNAVVGTPLMLAAPMLAIELPLRILAWETEGGSTRIAWNDPLYYAARYALYGQYDTLRMLREMLAALAATVA